MGTTSGAKAKIEITSEFVKIGKGTVDSAWRRRKPGERLIIRDKDCRGLALIVNATTMAWTFSYRPRGNDPLSGRRWPNKAITLGSPGSLSVEDARAEANRIKGQAAAGLDPAEEKKERLARQQRDRAATLDRVFEVYKTVLPRRQKLRGHGRPSPAYVAEEVAQTRMALDDMKAGSTPAAKLTAADILKGLSLDNCFIHPAWE